MTDESQPLLHTCEGVDMIEPHPFFYVQPAYNLRTSEHTELVMVVVPTTTGAAHVQVDYCPWCGTQVAKTLSFFKPPDETVIEKKADYYEYRKRFVQTAKAGEPLTKDQFDALISTYYETKSLVPYAKKRGLKASLTKEVKRIKELLLIE